MKRQQLERYRGMFSQVHTQWQFDEEEMRRLAARAGRKPGRRSGMRRLLPVAVVIAALLALAITAAATDLFGLSGYLFRREADQTGEGEIMVSLQGYADTPEYQAAQEWLIFLAGYDPDGSILAQAGCTIPEGVPENEYLLYGVYSQEMSETLEGIAAKYGLALHTARDYDLTPEELEQRTGCPGLLRAPEELAGIAAWEDGSFMLEGAVPGQTEGLYQVYYNRKGILSDIYVPLDRTLSYQTVTVAAGEKDLPVAMAFDGYYGIALVELEHGLFALNLRLGADENGEVGQVTQNMLETLLTRFDLAGLK